MVTPAHCRCFADGLRYTNDSPHARSFIHTVLVRGVVANRKHRVVVVRMLFGCTVTTRHCCTTTGLLHWCIHTARLLYCCSHTIRRSYRPVNGLFCCITTACCIHTHCCTTCCIHTTMRCIHASCCTVCYPRCCINITTTCQLCYIPF